MQEPWGSRWPPNLTWMNTLPRPNAVNPDTALRAEARSRDWPVHDFRSGGRVTGIALPIAAGAPAQARAAAGAAWPRGGGWRAASGTRPAARARAARPRVLPTPLTSAPNHS